MLHKVTILTYRHLVSNNKSLPLPLPCVSCRSFTKTLFERMNEVVPAHQERVKLIMSVVKNEKISDVTVAQAAGGMRGVKALICETSLLDINEGIRFRGLTLPEVEKLLPTAKVRGCKSEYPIPESMLWLLLTGEVPTNDEVKQLSEELTTEPYNTVPKHARKIIDELPVHQHPMSQYITAIMALQTESKFAAAYQDGVNKQKYWKYALDDTLRLISKIPIVSA
eukprot:144242_1